MAARAAARSCAGNAARSRRRPVLSPRLARVLLLSSRASSANEDCMLCWPVLSAIVLFVGTEAAATSARDAGMASAVLFLWKAVAQAGRQAHHFPSPAPVASPAFSMTGSTTHYRAMATEHASLSQVAKFSTPGTRRTAQGTAASDFTEEHVAVLDTARHLWSLR